MTNHAKARRVAAFAIVAGWLFALSSGALVLIGVASVAVLPLMGIYGAKLGDGFPAMLCLVVGGTLLVVSGWGLRVLLDISDKLKPEAES